MAVSLPGVKWPDVPHIGAVGAGRYDLMPDVPGAFSLTPSGAAEQENARQVAEQEVPGAEPEPLG